MLYKIPIIFELEKMIRNISIHEISKFFKIKSSFS